MFLIALSMCQLIERNGAVTVCIPVVLSGRNVKASHILKIYIYIYFYINH
jgi:hypothetical protein